MVDARAAALLSGALWPLAFAPFSQGYLTPLLLALLFLLWLQDGRVGRGWLLGLLFGLGQFGFGVFWIFNAIHRFGHAPLPAALLLTALFFLTLSLFPAAVGAAAVFLARRLESRDRKLFLFALLWNIGEWLRGWLFPWLEAGYSQLGGPLAGYAPLFGSYGVGLAVALTASGMVAVTLEGRRAAPWMLGLLWLWLLAALFDQVVWWREAGQPFQATLIQGNIPQDLKWDRERARWIFSTYLKLTREHLDADLIVWPETALPTFYHRAEAALEPLRRELRAHGTDLLLGAPYRDPQTGRVYNGVVCLCETFGVYRKRHLVPFGEYLPLRPVTGWVLDLLKIPLSDFDAGPDRQPLLLAAGHPVGVTICYEDAFARDVVWQLPEARYLVNVTNDAWFGGWLAPDQHLQMARMRAKETGRFLLRANNTGITAVIAPTGEVVAQAKPFVRTALTEEIPPLAGTTPYVLWGDWGIAAIWLALSFRIVRRRQLEEEVE